MRTMAAAALVAALALAVLGTANARTGSYTCSYKMIPSAPVYVTLYGSDLTPQLCASFNSTAHERRWYGYVPGRTRCLFASNTLYVFVAIKSPSALWGPIACSLFKTPSGWSRVS